MSARVDFAYLRAVRSPTGPRTLVARAVAIMIALRCDGGSVHLTRDEIGDEALLGRLATRKVLRELTSAGWLTMELGAGKPRWTLAVPEERPNALEDARRRRARSPEWARETEPTAYTLEDQRRTPSREGHGPTAYTLEDQRRTPSRTNGVHPTPSRSTPKRPQVDPKVAPVLDQLEPLGGLLGSSAPKPTQDQELVLRVVDPPKPKAAEPEPRAAPSRRPAARARPEGWSPSAKHRSLAADLGFGERRVELEAEKFCEHHDARGNLFADWNAAFGSWLRKAREIDDSRGVPREVDEPLFAGAPGEPWVPLPAPPPQRTPEEQAEIDAAFAGYQRAREASIKQHSRTEHRRIADLEHEARLARETDPQMLELIAITKRRREELAADEARRRLAAEMH